MLDVAITENYIKNIPWDINPAFCFTNDEKAYKEAFESVIEYVPNTDNMIRYDSDYWDFRPYYNDINSRDYVIIFSNASDDYVDYLKFFAIYGISRKSKISTIERRIDDFIGMISNIKKESVDKTFSLISTNDIEKYIENKNIGSSRKHSLYACAFLIYDFIEKNYHTNLSIDIEELKLRSANNKKLSKTEESKLPNIPEEYYTIIVNKLYEVLNDNSKTLSERMTAGLVLIATQTGLRIQDLLGIKTTDLKEKCLPVSNVKCFYLHYRTRKPSKAHSDMLEFDIYASELCAEAFNKMLEMRQNCEFKKQPYLYILDSNVNTKDKFPIADNRFDKEYKRLLYNNLKNEIAKERIGITKTKYKPNTKEDVYISVPSISQYRVHLATSLYNNGISLVYIQKYLGHLSEYMIGYYVRPKDKGPENAAFAEKIVKKIVLNDDMPLGHMGKELKESLISFIDTGKYNVATDTKAILNDLGEKLVIREKGSGLCCIKTSILPCKYDARTNETLCAYGLCPNIFHFYDSIGVTYMQFHALQDAYKENKDNGFERAAQKELNKIKDFIRRRLRPEIDELKRIVDKHRLNEFCAEHPDLKTFAEHYDEILEEINLWERY